MKRHSIQIIIVSIVAAGLLAFSCAKENKKDTAGPAPAPAASADTTAMPAPPADPEAKTADDVAKTGDAHNPESAGHVPCGAHSAGTPTGDGTKYPSVFKTMPVFGTKVSCPIKGETFEFSESRPTTEYNGKIYVFGCGGCKAIFLKDPEAAIKKYNFTEAP
ncbi:hypothetical protein KJ975_12240 [Myxococcota bacterium]|nr:hypothetical protein [Myxococcota bacterium]